MDLSKNHYMQLLICVLLCVISGVLFAYYYKEYVAPESFTIGSITTGTYKELEIKDYLSDDEVLFSQNINDVSFKVVDGVATYEYLFAQTIYNGLTNDYALFVNNELVTDTQNAGTFSADYVLNFRDVDNEIVNTTTINIDFTFQNAGSTLRVTFDDKNDSLALLMNYFKQNNFILTLCYNPFVFDNEVAPPADEVVKILVTSSAPESFYIDHNDKTYTVTKSSGLLATAKYYFAGLSEDTAVFYRTSGSFSVKEVDTDGEFDVVTLANNKYQISWTGATYITISFNASNISYV